MTSADDYIFQAKPKTGKCGQYVVDGSPLGESYICNLKQASPDEDTRYQYVSEDQSLLPEGKYSWWGIRALVDSSTDGCRYGGHVFTASFPYMLSQFRLAHTKRKKTPEIFFKKAGTLRYKKEICYVILVCADTDNLKQIRDLPPVTKEDHKIISFNGMLDPEGKVTDPEAKVYFNQQEFIDNNWNHVVFGFYFSPQCESDSLKLEKNKVQYDEDFRHNFCIGTFRVKEEYLPCSYTKSWVCPDDPSLPRDKDLKELVRWYN